MTLKRTNAAEFRHQIELQQQTGVVQDSAGQPSGTWYTWLTPFAKVEDLAGSENWRDEQIRSIASHRITLRGCAELAALTTEMRALFSGRVYNFVNINDAEERGIKIEILCQRED
jgi:SPP1 family predicted phage head-tail adaptor